MDKKIAIILHTFMRDNELFKCIKSIEKYVDNYKLYISDSGTISREKKKLYDRLKLEGHEIMLLPFDCSFTIARNLLIKKSREPYILKMDDDFEIIDKNTISGMMRVLELNKNIGLVATNVAFPDKLADYTYNIYKILNEDGDIIELRKEQWDYQRISNLKYYYCDITVDFFLARRGIFPQCNWDEDFRVGENAHDDFFFNIKFNTDWKIAFLTNFYINHNKTNNEKFYKFMRHRFTYLKKINKKWNIECIERC